MKKVSVVLKWAFAYFFVLFYVTVGYSAANPYSNSYYPIYDGSDSYIDPNEENYYRMAPILSKAHRGLHISVGTERSFMSFAMNPGAEALLIIDMDKDVIRYSKWNAKLIAASANLEEYRSIRLRAEKSELEFYLQDKNSSKESIKEGAAFLSEHFNSRLMQTFQHSQEVEESKRPFKDANYLYNEKHFDRIRSAILDSKFHFLQMDFTKKEDLLVLENRLLNLGQKVSVVDISNAWWALEYILPGELARFLKSLQPHTTKDSLLVSSDYSRLVRLLQASKKPYHQWNYDVYDFGMIDKFGAYSLFLFKNLFRKFLNKKNYDTKNFRKIRCVSSFKKT